MPPASHFQQQQKPALVGASGIRMPAPLTAHFQQPQQLVLARTFGSTMQTAPRHPPPACRSHGSRHQETSAPCCILGVFMVDNGSPPNGQQRSRSSCLQKFSNHLQLFMRSTQLSLLSRPVQYNLPAIQCKHDHFITFTHSVMAIKTHTIQVFLGGMSFFSKLLTGSLGLASNHTHLPSLLRAYAKSQLKSPCLLPLAADLLSVCSHTIHSGCSIPHVTQTLESMFLHAFFNFLRSASILF